MLPVWHEEHGWDSWDLGGQGVGWVIYVDVEVPHNDGENEMERKTEPSGESSEEYEHSRCP